MQRKIILIGLVAVACGVFVGRQSIKPWLKAVVDTAIAPIDLFLSHSWGELQEPRVLVKDSLIAHACGGIGGRTYTNSINALDSNYAKGHRVFELDLERTNDGKVVLIHDWEDSWRNLHPTMPAPGRRSLADFLGSSMVDDLRPMDWSLLGDWLLKHPDAYIVTDVKSDNVAILKILSERKELVSRVIPQIYNFRQYAAVKNMGYPRILLTLYRLSVGNWAVIQFAKTHPISGVVCWPGRGRDGDLVHQLRSLDIPVIAHTINSAKDVAELKGYGFTGVMTDFLTP